MEKKSSLQRKIIRLFTIVLIVPILALGFLATSNFARMLKQNTQHLTNQNLRQQNENLQIWLESYEDILYQMYTNDDVVEWTDRLNEGRDVAVTKNQLRRYMNALLNTKDYIRSITIITESGMIAACDQMTPATYSVAWMENFSRKQETIYEEVSADNGIHIYPTEYGTTFANKDYYLFHIAHRIIDYRDLEKKSGIVLISIDEDFLQNICQEETGDGSSCNFMLDETGRVISFLDRSCIGTDIFALSDTREEREASCRDFLKEKAGYDSPFALVSFYTSGKTGWTIVNVTDQSSYMHLLYRQVLLIALTGMLLFAVSMIFVVRMSGHMTKSVTAVVDTMKMAQAGNLDVSVTCGRDMPREVEIIAEQFNDMLHKLKEAQMRERKAVSEQQRAELKMLEAQINPHFLYNTLDTINWMAIDRDEFDISNAINSLASILRYAIADRNEMVTVSAEVDWLKKYIYLQQFRLKNPFVCSMEIPPELMKLKIHKLLLQPFVENALIHGFDGEKKENRLEIAMKKVEEELWIVIRDNGKGMDTEAFAERAAQTGKERSHIGMENAILRLRMYYGERARIFVKSRPGEGTEITLQLPAREEKKESAFDGLS